VSLFSQLARPGVRYDTGIVSGQEISPFYDPMIAKLITYGDNREATRKLMIEALHETALFGPRTNRDFLIACLENDKFTSGDFSTAFIAEEFGADGHKEANVEGRDLAVLALRHFLFDQQNVVSKSLGMPAALLNFSAADMLRTPYRLEVKDTIYDVVVATRATGAYQISVGEESFAVTVRSTRDARVEMIIDEQTIASHASMAGATLFVSYLGRSLTAVNLLALNAANSDASDGCSVLAPMHGRVIDVYVAAGDDVSIGDRLATVEAMKMQHEILAQIDGTVQDVLVIKEQQVAADDLMISIAAEED
jgi:geranyl-CoA carboxylase alpha subunit